MQEIVPMAKQKQQHILANREYRNKNIYCISTRTYIIVSCTFLCDIQLYLFLL